jgi:hypothetical protein
MNGATQTYQISPLSNRPSAFTMTGSKYQILLKLIGTITDETKEKLLDGLKGNNPNGFN